MVLKQFQFARGGDWGGMKAIERETQTLKDLKHSGIPRYLGSFETEDGFCLVQEYKEARPLSEPRSFTPDQIKQIAISLLEILVYLQDRIPPIFHRDIKPENVLLSDDLQVYLIDFGFARIGGENLAMSSVSAGTFGFMAPEQTRNLQLTKASDLYGLGLTLVCVIAQLKSHEIGEYVDYSNQLDQKAIEAKLKGCSFRFIEWLNQMVAPDPRKRFPDAATALEVLKPLYVKRTPEVTLSSNYLKFEATKVGEKLSQTLTLTNPIPETVLEGYWEVAPHPNDPPHTPDHHPWISFSPKTVKGNKVTCTVTVDTSQLKAGKKGNRNLIFHSNTTEKNNIFQISICTSQPPIEIPIKTVILKIFQSLYLSIIVFSLTYILVFLPVILMNLFNYIWYVLNSILNFISWIIVKLIRFVLTIVACIMTFGLCLLTDLTAPPWWEQETSQLLGYPLAVIIVIVLSIFFLPKLIRFFLFFLSKLKYLTYFFPPFKQRFSEFIFSVTFGISLSIGCIRGFATHFFLISGMTAISGLILFCMCIYPVLNSHHQLSVYRRKEQYLIEP